jgi:tetratricopeptide (TPR) repeat protein
MAKRALSILSAGYFLLLIGCFNDSLAKANQRQLERQQAELDRLKEEVARLQAQRTTYNYPAPSSCDAKILREATRKGGRRFAVGDFDAALGYYQDALTACPGNAQAHLNLARTYEALGDRARALEHYRMAAAASDADADSLREARSALSRLGG